MVPAETSDGRILPGAEVQRLATKHRCGQAARRAPFFGASVNVGIGRVLRLGPHNVLDLLQDVRGKLRRGF
jgi:hypothetical protein